jgi:N-methylhydantoinase A
MSEYSLGIDIGGTFTDLVIHDHDTGRRWGSKVLTTHADPQQGVVAGVRSILAESGLDPRGIGRVVHATTLFTNALIERKGAPTGLLVTDGFRDMLEIGRERKYDLYDIGIENPAPLVPRNLRLGVIERMRADGRVAEPLDEAQLLRQVDALRAAGVTSVALVFLHAYANPAHEEQAARAIAAHAPELFVTPSHAVVREIREYERASTTIASAYVKPIAAGYLAALARELTGLGIAAPLLLMLSGGGLTHAAEVNRNPVQMLESGPAAGALAAAFFGARDGVNDLLAFDMGGTTAKLSLVDGGEPLVAYGFEAARQKRFIEGSGLPIRLLTIELIEIGAGGGSIARRDEIGLLKVGPDSAGSEPGPACYARGGTAPTVTDANLLLGYLNPDFFAGGTLQIERGVAADAMANLAASLGLSTEATAAGIHEVVNENMAGAARVHIAERGRDPRRYALVCTGGGGPVHGYSIGASWASHGWSVRRHQAWLRHGGCWSRRPASTGWRRSVFASTVTRSPGSRLHSASSKRKRVKSSPRPGCRSTDCASTGLVTAAVSARALTLSYHCPPAPTPTMPSPAPRWPPRSSTAIARNSAAPHPTYRWSSSMRGYRCALPCPAGKSPSCLAPPVRRPAVPSKASAAPGLPKPAGLSTRRSTTATASRPTRKSAALR